jgi:hypothetical protein
VRLAIDSLSIDLEAFLDVSEKLQSPQSLAAGIPPEAVSAAALWTDLAKALIPFRDHALAMREELRIEGIVICECSPAVNPACAQGDHTRGHIVEAVWQVWEDDEGDFINLCEACAGSLGGWNRRPLQEDA